MSLICSGTSESPDASWSCCCWGRDEGVRGGWREKYLEEEVDASGGMTGAVLVREEEEPAAGGDGGRGGKSRNLSVAGGRRCGVRRKAGTYQQRVS